VLDKVLKIGTVAVSCPDGNFQHELDSHGGYSPGSDLSKSLVLDLASPLYSPGSKSKIYDRSGKGNNGTITGATWTRLSSGLWVLSYDGIDNVTTITNAANLVFGTGEFTIEAWVSLVATPMDANPVIIGKGTTGAGEWMLRFVEAIHTLNFYGASGAINMGDDLHTDIRGAGYQYVVVCRRGTAGFIYLNGVQVGTDADMANDLNSVANVTISNAAATRRWHGTSGLIGLHTVGWTTAQIASRYNQTRHLFGV